MLLVCRAEYGDLRAQSRDLVFKLFVITSILEGLISLLALGALS
jgi:hypothetical protein